MNNFITDQNHFDTIRREVSETAARRRDFSLNFRRHFQSPQKNKYGTSDYQLFGPSTRDLLYEMKSANLIQFLERVTGISGLIADPMDEGGGIHVIERDGFLGIHTDFPVHKILHLSRRVNVFYYLNDDDWQPDWGGDLELWRDTDIEVNKDISRNDNDKDRDKENQMEKKQPTVKIAPYANRLVIFPLDNSTFHGHPHPLKCPEHKTRRSIALYYYTQFSSAEEYQTMKALRQETTFIDEQ
jgi:Rps23 Pro-64 3,4-dihydroxylase Tpa1-like proline 4-hydroxylase